MRCQPETQEKGTYGRDNLWATDVLQPDTYGNVAVGETETDFFRRWP